MDTQKPPSNRQAGAALVLTLGVMFIMAMVMLIAAQYTLKTSKTVTDQSVTLEAQYVGESGLAWAKGYVQNLANRLDALGTNQRTLTDFLTLIANVCGAGQNTTTTSGCNVPTTGTAATAAKTAIAEFFRQWSGAPANDTYWQGVFSQNGHTVQLGNSTYQVYNTYKVNGVLTQSPLFSITRLEWDFNTLNGTSVMDAFRFCYAVGYYVSKGSTTTKGSRVVGQYPDSVNPSGSGQCPSVGSAGTSSATSGDPGNNSLPVDVIPAQSSTSAPNSGIDTSKIAGAVGIERTLETTAGGITTVRYWICGQTSNGNSGSCGNNKEYMVTYVINSNTNTYQVLCTQNGSTTTKTLASQNTLSSCDVVTQGQQAETIYFMRNHQNKLILVLAGKTNGNDTVAGWRHQGNTLDLYSNHVTLVYVSTGGGTGNSGCKSNGNAYVAGAQGLQTGLTVDGTFCKNTTASEVYNTIGNQTQTVTSGPVTYTFDPLTSNLNVLYTGRWIQLSNGDL